MYSGSKDSKAGLSQSALSYLQSLETNSKALRQATKVAEYPKSPPKVSSSRRPSLSSMISELRSKNKRTSTFDSDDELNESLGKVSSTFHEGDSLSSLSNRSGERVMLDLDLGPSLETHSPILPKGTPGLQVGRKSVEAMRKLRNSIDLSLQPPPRLEKKIIRGAPVQEEELEEMEREHEVVKERIEPVPRATPFRSPFKGAVESGSSEAESIDFEVPSELPERILGDRRVSFRQPSRAGTSGSRSSSSANSSSEVSSASSSSRSSASSTSESSKSSSMSKSSSSSKKSESTLKSTESDSSSSTLKSTKVRKRSKTRSVKRSTENRESPSDLSSIDDVEETNGKEAATGDDYSSDVFYEEEQEVVETSLKETVEETRSSKESTNKEQKPARLAEPVIEPRKIPEGRSKHRTQQMERKKAEPENLRTERRSSDGRRRSSSSKNRIVSQLETTRDYINEETQTAPEMREYTAPQYRQLVEQPAIISIIFLSVFSPIFGHCSDNVHLVIRDVLSTHLKLVDDFLRLEWDTTRQWQERVEEIKSKYPGPSSQKLQALIEERSRKMRYAK